MSIESISKSVSNGDFRLGKSNSEFTGLAIAKVNSPEQIKTRPITNEPGAINLSKKQEKEVLASIEKANRVLYTQDSHLQFSIHEETKDIMVRIIDNSTDEVLKEIPPEKILNMVAKLLELSGIMVDEQA